MRSFQSTPTMEDYLSVDLNADLNNRPVAKWC